MHNYIIIMQYKLYYSPHSFSYAQFVTVVSANTKGSIHYKKDMRKEFPFTLKALFPMDDSEQN